jgi:hypothetical protein
MRLFMCWAHAVACAILLAACGGQPQPTIEERYGLALKDMDQATSPLEYVTAVELAGEMVTVDIAIGAAASASDILLHFTYDDKQLEVRNAEFTEPLGPAASTITLVATRRPGLVGIGQVRFDGQSTQLPAGTPIAHIVLGPPGRTVSDALPGDNAAAAQKLRAIKEFNTDEPFSVSANPNFESLLEVRWEEANDGDYNGDGLVSINDLTPLGALLTQHLHLGSDYTGSNPVYNYLTSGDFSARTRRANLRRISQLGLGTGGQDIDDYNAVVREDPQYQAPNVEGFYLATQSDLTAIGANLGNFIAGYQVLVFDGHPNPTPSSTQPDPVNDRYIVLHEFIPHTAPEEGMPVAKYLFSFELSRLANLLPGRQVYIGVRPVTQVQFDPGTDQVGAGHPGAFTYYHVPFMVEEPARPPAPTWTGTAGIEEIEIGHEYGASTDLEFRIDPGTATLPIEWVAAGWQVVYFIYYRKDDAPDDPSTAAELFVNGTDGLPVRKYWPNNIFIDYDKTRPMFHLGPPAVGYYPMPPAPGFDGDTISVGVRAVAVLPTAAGTYFIGSYDSNLDIERVPLSGTIPDNMDPDFAGMHKPVKAFAEAFQGYGPEVAYTFPGGVTLQCVEMRRPIMPHFLSDPSNPSIGPACDFKPTLILSGLRDYVDANRSILSDQSKLELRLEIWRTTMPQNQFLNYVQANGVEQWLQTAAPVWDSVTYWKDATPFMTSLEHYGPEGPPAMYNVPKMLENGRTDFEPWIGIPETLLEPGFSEVEVPLRIPNYVPVTGGTWPDTDFVRQENNPIRFVYVPALEQHNGLPINYVAVAAVSDAENNTTFDNVGPSVATYLGRVVKSSGIKRVDWPVTDWSKYRADRVSSAAAQQQARFPDIAFDPLHNRIGVSFFDAVTSKATVQFRNLTTGARNGEFVNTAAEGDTSLAFDLMGNPQIAFFALDGNGDGTLDPVGSHMTSAQRSTASAGTAGIYYRRNDGISWQPLETVFLGSVATSAEHVLFAPGPIPDNQLIHAGAFPGTLSSPSMSTRNTGTWSISNAPSTAPLSGMYLDGVLTMENQQMVQYVGVYAAATSSQPAMLQLAKRVGNVWQTIPLDTDVVGGFQSVQLTPSGQIAISYMAGNDNHLRYGVLTGSGFVKEDVPGTEQAGYQSALVFTPAGEPTIFSVCTDNTLQRSQKRNGTWETWTVMPAAGQDPLLTANTVSAVSTGTDFAVAWLTPYGGLSWGTMSF